jgi:conjugal transfer pilus assembly protein TraD
MNGGRRRLVAALVLALGVLAAPAGPAVLLGLGVTMLAARLAACAIAPIVGRLARRLLPVPREAVRLGRDPTGRAVALSDEQLGAHALLVGASGAGKTTTLQTILADRIARGHPVVAIDMKGSPAFARTLADAADRAGRPLQVWTPDGPSQWNPLAHGGPTALKDKLISAERVSEPHYRRAAERYLQTALQVLAAGGPPGAPHLDEVVSAMEPSRLRALARRTPEPLAGRVATYLEGLTSDQLSAARGLGTRLALLSESDAGRWLSPAAPAAGSVTSAPADSGTSASADSGTSVTDGEIDLGRSLDGGPVVLFSINASVYGALGGQLGALAIQDLTSAAGRRLSRLADADGAMPPATVAIDEFSALGADNVLALLARGREAGVGVLLATQELADLERAGRGFRDQVLGITAVTLAHRQEVHESALAISRLAGTRMVWRETQPLIDGPGAAGYGSRRQHEEPLVHPNAIKRLATGQLVLLTAVPRPTVARVRVQAPRRRSASRQRGDQAAPGVTR